MNFYPFHIGDYISHTSHLSDEEDLAYRRLIDLYYQTEKPFPNDLVWIARRAKTNTEVVARLLFDFFQIIDDYWHNTRADREIAKYHAMQDGGRKGAALRWGKGSDSPPKHPPMQTKNQEPLTKNHSIEVAKAPKAKRLSLEELPKEWEEFCKTERKDLNPVDVFNQFKDYWIAQGGQKGAKLDWFATWRNWVRNQRSQNPVSKQADDKQWMFSNQGIEAKAKELGVNDYGIANHQQLKDKILLVMAKKAMQ